MRHEISERDVNTVAAMLTDDPDILIEGTVSEWWGKKPQLSPLQAKLSALTKITDPNMLANLEQEFTAFSRYQPTLAAQGEPQAIEAFVKYKKTGKMPSQRDPAELDTMTHMDRGFRA